MRGRSHLVFGATAGAGIAHVADLDQPASVGCAALAAVAALLPDLDHPRSLLGRHLPRGSHELVEHRGATHSLAWALLAGWLTMRAAEQLGIPRARLVGAIVAAGVGSHLLADAITEQGIPWLWPLSGRRLALPRLLAIKTGGLIERLLVTATVTAWLVQLTGTFSHLQTLLPGI